MGQLSPANNMILASAKRRKGTVASGQLILETDFPSRPSSATSGKEITISYPTSHGRGGGGNLLTSWGSRTWGSIPFLLDAQLGRWDRFNHGKETKPSYPTHHGVKRGGAFLYPLQEPGVQILISWMLNQRQVSRIQPWRLTLVPPLTRAISYMVIRGVTPLTHGYILLGNQQTEQ